jgi:hypothetical protein
MPLDLAFFFFEPPFGWADNDVCGVRDDWKSDDVVLRVVDEGVDILCDIDEALWCPL